MLFLTLEILCLFCTSMALYHVLTTPVINQEETFIEMSGAEPCHRVNPAVESW